ncbi:MAG: hypothetical protein HYZ65_09080 [Burkholderiales bacterium]|nr:hypothetical protein [Burkholderiales bacterium]
MDTNFLSGGCRRLSVVAASTLMVAALGIAPAHAIDNLFFELDANAFKTTTRDDWNSISTTKTTGIVSDSDPAVFRQGSKDIQDISQWRFDLGSSPPKDDMLHAYAAAYNATATGNGATSGDLVIYFGADRAAFNGTASLGFWFFKNPVARNNATGAFVDPSTGLPAHHADGDTLIAFEYTNGGAVTGVRVFKWMSGALSDMGTIGVSPTSTAGMYCDGSDHICGGTNPGNIPLPWTGTTVAAGQFFEGGINISAVVGGDTCFSSFMATSRSSDQSNASIKNFILHSFPVCHVSVSKSCPSASFNASNNMATYTINGKILNDGGGLLSSITLSDNPAIDSGSLGYFTCLAGTNTPDPTKPLAANSTLVPNASLCYQATSTLATLVTTDTVTVTASTGAGTVTNTATATCPSLAPPAGLAVTKSCDVDLVAASNELSVKVNYSGTVQNTGQVALSNVKVCEVHEVVETNPPTYPCDVTPHTEINIGTLAVGESKPYSGFYVPTNALNINGGSALLLPHTAVFQDKVGGVGTGPAIFGSLPAVATPVQATCPMCP